MRLCPRAQPEQMGLVHIVAVTRGARNEGIVQAVPQQAEKAVSATKLRCVTVAEDNPLAPALLKEVQAA